MKEFLAQGQLRHQTLSIARSALRAFDVFFSKFGLFFFSPTSILKIIDILFKMADFGDIDRIFEHCDSDDDDDDNED